MGILFKNDSLKTQRLRTRRRSEELDLSRTMIQRILKKDLQLKPWKPVSEQFLSEEDLSNRILCCSWILAKYRNSDTNSKLFFSD